MKKEYFWKEFEYFSDMIDFLDKLQVNNIPPSDLKILKMNGFYRVIYLSEKQL